MKNYQIYQLVDPRTNAIRYVGLSKDTQKRYKQHIDPHKATGWIKELLEQGIEPLLEIVEDNISALASAQEREKYWICHYTEHGHSLENWVHNADAHSERDERRDLHQRLFADFSQNLPPEKAELLTRMTMAGYDMTGYDAWDTSYRVVTRTLALLHERYGIQRQFNEIDAAKITFNLFGYEWKGEA